MLGAQAAGRPGARLTLGATPQMPMLLLQIAPTMPAAPDIARRGGTQLKRRVMLGGRETLCHGRVQKLPNARAWKMFTWRMHEPDLVHSSARNMLTA